MVLSENALKILESRYLLRNNEGLLIENPEQLFQRVAKHIAKAEEKFKTGNTLKYETEFFRLMNDLKFLPNSPTLMNAGTSLGQLSACFVLPIQNDAQAIKKTLHNTTLIHQSGGGTGFNFSAIEPNQHLTNSKDSAGPVSLMKEFNAATEIVKQSGRRRGANMAVLNVDHPDIEEFIDSKKNNEELKNFNISVGISNAFMNAMISNTAWELKHPLSKKTVEVINARDLWDKIVSSAWHSGDPGLLFVDTINKANPTPRLGKINCTNPCGEVPLLDHESCNLGSIDVAKFVNDKCKDVDWNELEQAINISVRFLDNVIEMNDHILPEIETIVKGNRKIGLGIMGWAHLLMLLEIPYDSNKAIELARTLMNFFKQKSYEASMILAKERGTFPNWESSIHYPNTPLRNATLISIAPTGTISLIANTSSSIEPIFSLATERKNVLDKETLFEIDPLVVHYLKTHHLDTQEVLEKMQRTGSISNSNLPENVLSLFKTAHEISPMWHLKHQAVYQEFTDNAVSKTINLSEDATNTDINDIYFNAWNYNLKGVTVFRNRSKKDQVLYAGITGNCSNCSE